MSSFPFPDSYRYRYGSPFTTKPRFLAEDASVLFLLSATMPLSKSWGPCIRCGGIIYSIDGPSNNGDINLLGRPDHYHKRGFCTHYVSGYPTEQQIAERRRAQFELFLQRQPEATVDDCPICCEEMRIHSQTAKTDCGHTFHKICIEAWKSTTRRNGISVAKCPMCRAPLLADDVTMDRSATRNVGAAATLG